MHMRESRLRKRAREILFRLEQAERRGDAEAAQKAYEDLFTICHRNRLDLNTLLQEPRKARSRIVAALRALWPVS
jgi:hypothetical protein